MDKEVHAEMEVAVGEEMDEKVEEEVLGLIHVM